MVFMVLKSSSNISSTNLFHLPISSCSLTPSDLIGLAGSSQWTLSYWSSDDSNLYPINSRVAFVISSYCIDIGSGQPSVSLIFSGISLYVFLTLKWVIKFIYLKWKYFYK